VTLATLQDLYPALFYEQSWFDGEAFMATEPDESFPRFEPVPVDGQRRSVTSADLAWAYVQDPTASVWRRFLWTDDADQYGNRVYVGGVGEYGIEAFQIHRHLTPRAWFVRPV
jgi:hypothetical protein